MEIQKTSVSHALEQVFREAGNFVVIGLSGRTGSGCSTAADILSSTNLHLPDVSQSHYEGNERRKYRIIKSYIESNWHPFRWLQVRAVITRYILTLNYKSFLVNLSNILGIERSAITKELEPFRPTYNEAHDRINEYLNLPERSPEEIDLKKEAAFEIYFNWLPQFSNELRDQLKKLSQNAYTRFYQAVGDNIRSSGKPASRTFNSNRTFDLAITINKVIKSARYVSRKNNEPCYILIDAIRNPYEAIYFKERYADFYLVSINTSNDNRLSHLRKSHKFSESQISELDNKEYPKKLTGHAKFVSQNVQKCIELSDIHINNPRTDQFGHSELRCQLAWYVTLILHPGLIMPTAIERCMQIAASAKLNSGCISRQVGAIVTDQNYSVKAIGWNNSPQGQVPCLLRSAEDLINGSDEEAYSTYEKNDEKFREALLDKYEPYKCSKLLNGRNLSFCFKDLKNEVDNDKNQVHTRSLHAEENAFLQITKYGGQKVNGGILFTTASPCELCSKKAYQLGITEVIYIDPYPGIANEHTLSIGKHSPKLTLFRGAVGEAYHKLYRPIMPYKDELETLLGLKEKANQKEIKLKNLETENIRLREEIERLKHGSRETN
ncbi:anti-phage dCTP deaminase [Gilvimarinus sp. F26214L]|uniref:anti-phage dCTP deaminase n=1 Tax=Gilvimarinus sp. DZF01 TaxID=3461371 RepID=UPI0040459B16